LATPGVGGTSVVVPGVGISDPAATAGVAIASAPAAAIAETRVLYFIGSSLDGFL